MNEEVNATNTDIREFNIINWYSKYTVDLASVIQFTYCGTLGVEQFLGICCSPSSNDSGHSNIALKS